MKIIMQESRWVSPDGWAVRYLRAEEHYDLPPMLARWLVSEGYEWRKMLETNNRFSCARSLTHSH